MPTDQNHNAENVFALHEIAASLPTESDTLLVDRYLVRNPTASARVFRVYRGTPAHFHSHCEEFLYVISGRGTFWIGDSASIREFRPGHLIAFPRGTVHAMPELLELPVVFLSVDVPLRDPADITFVHPDDGSPETFIREEIAH